MNIICGSAHGNACKRSERQDDMGFAEWLQKELDNKGWDSLDLALECYISEQSIKNYLHGDRYPNLSSFLQIVKAFGKRIEIVDDGGSKWTIN